MAAPAIVESPDFWRIAQLPRRQYDRAQAERDARELTPELTTPAGKAAGVSLRPVQAFVLREFHENRGAYAAITVGGGKTLISFLASYVLNAKRPVLVIPESLFEKTHKEFAEYARYWITPRPQPRLIGYKELTRVENLDLLERIEPDLYIFDEVDILANQDGSATKRVARDIDARKVPALAMTGTSSRFSICDFSHFLAWTLKEGAPVPLDPDELQEWACALDEKEPRNGRRRNRAGVLVDLSDLPANDVEGMSELGLARAMFRQRMSETPGCLIIDEDDCNQPLTIRQILAPEDGVLNAHFDLFRTEDVTPDGWDVTDPLSKWRFESELGAGFFNVWDPRPPQEWRDARKAFAKFVRAAIERTAYSRRPLDTEKAVKKAFPNHDVIIDWREIEPTFKPNSVPVWSSGSVVYAIAEWSERNPGALIWTPHIPLGEAIAEVTGLNYYGAKGLTASGASIERSDPSKTAILSVAANLRGRNLQDRNNSLIVGGVQSGKLAQQVYGRTHRYGQKRPVNVDIMLTSGGSAYSFDMQCLEARSVLSREGIRQKVLRAHIKRATFNSKALRWVRKEVQ